MRNSNSNSILTGSDNSNLSFEEFSLFNKKVINVQNSVTLLSLEDLLKYLPSAKFDVMLKLMSTKNFTPDEIKDYESNIIRSINNKEINNNYNLISIVNKDKTIKEDKLINNNKVNQNMIKFQNVNLNINLCSHDDENLPKGNIDLKDEFHPKNAQSKNDNNINKINPFDNAQQVNNHNHSEYDLFEGIEKNFIYNPISDFRNLDMFSLENNILDMCDDHSLLYSDSNFNFLDHQVDNIIDNMFIKNNVQINSNENEDCNLCFNKINPNKDLEGKVDYMQIINNKENDHNDKSLDYNKENIQTDSSSNCNNENKKIMLDSLIFQLEDLEKLVKSTKQQLMKYNNSNQNSENGVIDKSKMKA